MLLGNSVATKPTFCEYKPKCIRNYYEFERAVASVQNELVIPKRE
jgi:hypothetical protein